MTRSSSRLPRVLHRATSGDSQGMSSAKMLKRTRVNSSLRGAEINRALTCVTGGPRAGRNETYHKLDVPRQRKIRLLGVQSLPQRSLTARLPRPRTSVGCHCERHRSASGLRWRARLYRIAVSSLALSRPSRDWGTTGIAPSRASFRDPLSQKAASGEPQFRDRQLFPCMSDTVR